MNSGRLDPVTISRLSVRDVLDGLEVWEASESDIRLIVEVQASIGDVTNCFTKGQLLCGKVELKHIVIWSHWRIVERCLVIIGARTKDEIEAIASVSALELSEREQRRWR